MTKERSYCDIIRGMLRMAFLMIWSGSLDVSFICRTCSITVSPYLAFSAHVLSTNAE